MAIIVLSVISSLVVFHILFNKYIFIVKPDGFIYKTYHNNYLFEKNLLGKIKAICIFLYMIFLITKFEFLFDEFFVYMNGSQPNLSNFSSLGGPANGGNPNPNNNQAAAFINQDENDKKKYARLFSSSIFPSLEGAKIEKINLPPISYDPNEIVLGDMSKYAHPDDLTSNLPPINGHFMYKHDYMGNGHYIIAVDDLDGTKIRQLQRGALQDCIVEEVYMRAPTHKFVHALNLNECKFAAFRKDGHEKIYIPNVFTDRDTVVDGITAYRTVKKIEIVDQH